MPKEITEHPLTLRLEIDWPDGISEAEKNEATLKMRKIVSSNGTQCGMERYVWIGKKTAIYTAQHINHGEYGG